MTAAPRPPAPEEPPAEALAALKRLERGHELRPTTRRARLVIIVLAVLTAVAILLAVLDPWARLERMNRPPPDRPACVQGQDTDCVGGRVPVLIVAPPPPLQPPAAPASGPRP